MPESQLSITARLRAVSDRCIEAAAVAVTVAMLGCVILGVITRAIGDPLIWTDEMARYFLVWLAALGWMIASRRRSHIRINYFVEKLPEGARRVAEVVIQAAVLVFGVLLVRNGLDLVSRNMDLEATAVPISIAWMYAPIVLIGLVLVVEAIAQAAEAVAGPVPRAFPLDREVVE